MGYYLVHWYMHNGSDRRRGKKEDKNIFKEIRNQNFQNFLKNINLHIQESPWTPNRIKAETQKQTHDIKSAKRQRKGENLESSKRKMTCNL